MNNFTTINPANHQKIAKYTYMEEEQALDIAASVNQSFKFWKNTKYTDRIKLFEALAKNLHDNARQYADLITSEMGKRQDEAIAEVEKCAKLASILAEQGQDWLAEQSVDAGGKKHRITFEPLGVIYLIMPWNYPFWQPFKVALLPLFAGNTIILKHASNVTGTALAIEKIFTDSGFPKDTFRTVVVKHEVSDKLVESDYVQAISLTGSVESGSHVAALAGKNLKKTVMELGGSDPFIILDDADINKAVDGTISGRLGNCGQVCIGAKRIIIDRSILDKYTNLLTEKVSQLKIGDPKNSDTDIGPLVNEKAVSTMEEFIQDARYTDAKILYGGNRPNLNGAYFEPTIIVQGKEKTRLYSEEAFGPIIYIIPVEGENEAIQVANDSIFGLNSSVWTSDTQRGERLAEQLNTGGVFINHISVSHPLIPLGGIKHSGYGRELSHLGILEFVNIKPINVY